jgi:hypothetical protein
MDTADVQVGSTITNGSSALQITERVERDTRWGTPSWRGMCIPLEAFGGNLGMTDTVPDYLLGSWRHVPFEWRPVTGGGLEERYVWTPDWRRLQREVRRMVQPTVDGIRGHLVTTPEEDEVRRRLTLEATPLAPFPVDCRSEHGEGHPDCPKCWAWSERNPNALPRPVDGR